MNWHIKPVTVSVDVPVELTRVYEFLDVLANHEPGTAPPTRAYLRRNNTIAMRRLKEQLAVLVSS
jgi:hypothetical protein